MFAPDLGMRYRIARSESCSIDKLEIAVRVGPIECGERKVEDVESGTITLAGKTGITRVSFNGTKGGDDEPRSSVLRV